MFHISYLFPFKLVFLRIVIASGSIARVNNRGDRGQPCLVPRHSLKGVKNNQFVKTTAHQHKEVDSSKKMSPLYRTFEDLKQIQPLYSVIWQYLYSQIYQKLLRTLRILWNPWHSCTKLSWSEWTIFGRSTSSHLADTLQRTLRSLLRSEIGL